MIQPELTLISHKLCAFVQRATIVLLEKNVAFERIDIDLVTKPTWFLAMSPTGKVPMLRVQRDGIAPVALFESVAICEYLDETLGGPTLHSKDPLTRAQHRAWIEFGTSILMDAWAFLNATDEETAQAKRLDVRVKLTRIEEALSIGPYFDNARFGMVDAVFAPIYRWFDSLQDCDFKAIFEGLPKVAIWREALRARASVQNAVAPDYARYFRDHLRGVGALLTRKLPPNVPE